MTDRDYSSKIKSDYNPTKDEVIEFAYDRELISNAQDWEIGVVYEIENVKAAVYLANDKNCPRQRYFLRCLYLFTGDFMLGDNSFERNESVKILEYAKQFDSQEIKDWIRRSEELLKNPEKYDYDYWKFGTKYLAEKYMPKKKGNYCKYFGDELIIFEHNGNSRLMNKQGQIIIGVEYDSIEKFEEGIAIVRKDEKYGYIDSRGVEIIPTRYSHARSFHNGKGHVFEGDRNYYINKRGETIEEIAQKIKNPSIEITSDSFVIEINDRRYEFSDVSEYSVNDLVFAEIFPFEKDLAVFYLAFDDCDFNKWGIIDANGKFIVEPQFHWIGVFVDDIVEVKKDEKWGYVNRKGELITDIIFDETRPFCEDLAKVKIGDKWGFINKSGDFVIEHQFNIAFNFEQGVARVQLDGKWAVINKSGKIIYEGFADMFKEGFAVVPIDKKYGYINNLGKLIVGGEFDEAYSFREGLAVVKVDEKYGFVNKKGEIVIEVKYEDAYSFRGGIAPIKIEGKWGFADNLGNIVVKPQFDDIYIDDYWGSK